SRPTLVAALSVLGYLPPTTSDAIPDDAEVKRAVQIYASQSGIEGRRFDPNRLYMDAARTLALLGAKTAQRLRADMAMLKAVESAAQMAENALAEMQSLAKSNPDARPILAQAKADVQAIHSRRTRLLEELDAGRDYYADLLTL